MSDAIPPEQSRWQQGPMEWQWAHTLGILAPRAVYLSGFFRKSTTSCSSSLAPSTPCKRPAISYMLSNSI